MDQRKSDKTADKKDRHFHDIYDLAYHFLDKMADCVVFIMETLCLKNLREIINVSCFITSNHFVAKWDRTARFHWLEITQVSFSIRNQDR